MLRLADYSIAIVMLAAGRGERMGAASKLLLPLGDGEPVIAHSVRNALAMEPVMLMVVVRPDQPELVEALRARFSAAVKIVPNPRYMEGMGASLVAGIGALGEGTEAAVVMLSDMPRVEEGIVRRLLEAYKGEGKPVAIPRYGGEVGPPTLFGRQAFAELMRLEGEAGGRQVVAAHPEWACFVPFSEEERPADVDTPEDYERLLNLM